MVERVRLPSTLKRIEYRTFENCNNLEDIKLPEQLEYIGAGAFSKSGLQSVVFPKSVRVVAKRAFFDCRKLRTAVLNEGLEVLGCSEDDEKEFRGIAFCQSGIKSIRIPSTLKVIEVATFSSCWALKSVEFSEGLEKIGIAAFRESGVENIVLPASTKIVGAEAFK